MFISVEGDKDVELPSALNHHMKMKKLNVDRLITRANKYLKQREIQKAKELYLTVLSSFPKNLSAIKGLKSAGAAEEREKNTEFKGLDAETLSIIELYHSGMLKDVIEKSLEIVTQRPSNILAWSLMGTASSELGDIGLAEDAFRQILKIDPKNFEAHNNLGNILQGQEQFDLAITHYEKAIKLKPDYASAHSNLGNAQQQVGQISLAIEAYKTALLIEPSHVDANYNLGTTLLSLGSFSESALFFSKVIAADPLNAHAHNNLGNAFQEQGLNAEAIEAYEKAIALKPLYAEAHNNLGNALQQEGFTEQAIRAYENTISILPESAQAQAQLLFLRREICDWGVVFEHLKTLSLGIDTQPIPPAGMLALDDSPKRQMLRANSWAKSTFTVERIDRSTLLNENDDRIKLAYLGADFHDHATLHLLSGVLKNHNKVQFEIFVFSYGHTQDSIKRTETIESVEHFVDVRGFSDTRIVELVRAEKIDVAIDLKGYTRHSRSQLFEVGLAPVQINWLGFPGTMSTKAIDYIIADTTVIPFNAREFYSESVIYLPNSYQPNDNSRVIAKTNTSRSDFGIPNSSLVLCCFNSSYKISAEEFDIWMRILLEIPSSVLWLMQSNERVVKNLRKEATTRNINPERLIFATNLPHAEHLARHQHADLFIDTFKVNAHTTASDALWSGLPMVTMEGEQFASRVGASLLRAINMPELITSTPKEYEYKILELLKNTKKLSDLKTKLKLNRKSAPLFDTLGFTRDLERGLEIAHQKSSLKEEVSDIFV